MGFSVVNTNIFELPGTNGRFVHLASVHNGVREFMCFLDALSQKCYIEEITGGSLTFIEDDNLAFDLAKFCDDKGFTDMKKVWELSQLYRRKKLLGNI